MTTNKKHYELSEPRNPWIRNITLAKLEWDVLGGFDFTVFHIEVGRFEGSLFALWSRWNKRLVLEVFFIRFDITKPFT